MNVTKIELGSFRFHEKTTQMFYALHTQWTEPNRTLALKNLAVLHNTRLALQTNAQWFKF